MAQYLIIHRATKQGDILRPTDWMERLAEQLCSFDDRCSRYHPMLRPIIYKGERCLIMDPELQKVEPIVFQTVLDFIEENALSYEWMSPD